MFHGPSKDQWVHGYEVVSQGSQHLMSSSEDLTLHHVSISKPKNHPELNIGDLMYHRHEKMLCLAAHCVLSSCL